MIVTMKTEGGGSHGVLAGSAEGRNFLANMVRKTGGYSIEPEAILLDFTGIEVATSSYLREGVVRLRDMLRSTHAERDALDEPTDIAAATAAAFQSAGGCAHGVESGDRRAAYLGDE